MVKNGNFFGVAIFQSDEAYNSGFFEITTRALNNLIQNCCGRIKKLKSILSLIILRHLLLFERNYIYVQLFIQKLFKVSQ